MGCVISEVQGIGQGTVRAHLWGPERGGGGPDPPAGPVGESHPGPDEKGTSLGRLQLGERGHRTPTAFLMRILLVTALIALHPLPHLSAQTPGVFDHSLFDELLQTHVSREGQVDYDAFDARPEFQQYLAALADARLELLSESERLALWINAYNALTSSSMNRPGGSMA
jgi:hypothetical protein